MVVVIDNSRRRPGIAGRKTNSSKSVEIYYRAQSGGIIYEGNSGTIGKSAIDSAKMSHPPHPPSSEFCFDELSYVETSTTKERSNKTTTPRPYAPQSDDSKKTVRGIESRQERQLSPCRNKTTTPRPYAPRSDDAKKTVRDIDNRQATTPSPYALRSDDAKKTVRGLENRQERQLSPSRNKTTTPKPYAPRSGDAKKTVRGIEIRQERQPSPCRKLRTKPVRQTEESSATSSESPVCDVRLFDGAVACTPNVSAQSQSLSLPCKSTTSRDNGLPPTLKATKTGANDTLDSVTQVKVSIIDYKGASLLLRDVSAAQVAALLSENASLRQAVSETTEKMNRADRKHQTTIDALQEEFNRKIEEMQKSHNQDITEIKEQTKIRLLEAERKSYESVDTQGLEHGQARLVSQDGKSEALPLRVGESEVILDDNIRPVRRSSRGGIPFRESLICGKKQVPRNLFKGKQPMSSVNRSVITRLSNDASLASKRTTETAFLTYGGTPLVSCKRLRSGLQYVVRSPSFGNDD